MGCGGRQTKTEKQETNQKATPKYERTSTSTSRNPLQNQFHTQSSNRKQKKAHTKITDLPIHPNRPYRLHLPFFFLLPSCLSLNALHEIFLCSQSWTCL